MCVRERESLLWGEHQSQQQQQAYRIFWHGRGVHGEDYDSFSALACLTHVKKTTAHTMEEIIGTQLLWGGLAVGNSPSFRRRRKRRGSKDLGM